MMQNYAVKSRDLVCKVVLSLASIIPACEREIHNKFQCNCELECILYKIHEEYYFANQE
jgi:hypothetical protein